MVFGAGHGAGESDARWQLAASVLETSYPDGMPTVRRPGHVPKNGFAIGSTNSTAKSLRLNRVNTRCVTKGMRGID